MTSRRWWILGTVLALASVVGTWLGAHSLRRGLPPPLWTESALPPLARAEDDGWSRLAVSGAASGRMDTHESELCLPDRPASFADVVDQRLELRAAIDTPVAARDLLTATAVFGQPRLTDQCPVDPAIECPSFALHHLHGAAEIDALARAVDGDWDAALAQTTQLLTADADLLAHARDIVTQMVALIDARHAVALARVLLDGLAHPPDGPSAPPARDALAGRLQALSAALDAMRAVHVDGTRLVVLDYLRRRVELQLIARAPPRAAMFTYDERMTMSAIDRYYRALMRYARRPTTPPPSPPSTDGLVWRLWNPTGATVILLTPDTAPIVLRFETDHAKLLRECDAARALLSAL